MFRRDKKPAWTWYVRAGWPFRRFPVAVSYFFRKPVRKVLAAVVALGLIFSVETFAWGFDNTNILVELAVNHIYQRRYTQAYDVLKSAYEQSPRHPGVHFNLGRLFELTGNFQEAMKQYRLAVVLDPSMVAARRGIARCSVELKRIQYQEQAMAMDPTMARPEPSTVRSMPVQRPSSAPIVNQPGRVEPPSRPAVTPPPQLPPARTQPRVTTVREALPSLPPLPQSPQLPSTDQIRLPPVPSGVAKMVRDLPRTPEENNAETLINRGKHEQALPILQMILIKTPDNPRVHYLIGRVYSAKGELFSAIKHLEEVIRVDEHFYNAYYLLAQNYAKVNLLEDAIKNYLIFFAVKPSAGVAVEIARVYERKGNNEIAKQYYAKANTMNPGNPNLQSRLAAVQSDIGNDLYLRANHAYTTGSYEDAISLYQQALSTVGLNDTYRRDAMRKVEMARMNHQQQLAAQATAREGFRTTRQVYGTVNLRYAQLADIGFKTRFTGPVMVEWRGMVARRLRRHGREFLLMIKELSRDELNELNKDRNDYRLNRNFTGQPLFLIVAPPEGAPLFAKEGSMITFTGSTNWRFYDITNDHGQSIKLPSIDLISAYPVN